MNLLAEVRFLQDTIHVFSSSCSPSPLSRQRPSSPATPKGRTASPSPAASPKPPSARGSPSTPKGRPKRPRTPARIDHRTSSPAPLERVKEPRRPATPEERKGENKSQFWLDWKAQSISLDFLFLQCFPSQKTPYTQALNLLRFMGILQKQSCFFLNAVCAVENARK